MKGKWVRSHDITRLCSWNNCFSLTLLKRIRCQILPALFCGILWQFSFHSLCNSSCYIVPACHGKLKPAWEKQTQINFRTASLARNYPPAERMSNDEEFCESVHLQQWGKSRGGQYGSYSPGKIQFTFGGLSMSYFLIISRHSKICLDTLLACLVAMGKFPSVSSNLLRFWIPEKILSRLYKGLWRHIFGISSIIDSWRWRNVIDGLMFTSFQSGRNLAIMTKLKNIQNMYYFVTLSKLNSTLYLIAKNLWSTCWRGLASWSSTRWTPLCTPGTTEAAEPEKYFCSSMF